MDFIILYGHNSPAKLVNIILLCIIYWNYILEYWHFQTITSCCHFEAANVHVVQCKLNWLYRLGLGWFAMMLWYKHLSKLEFYLNENAHMHYYIIITSDLISNLKHYSFRSSLCLNLDTSTDHCTDTVMLYEKCATVWAGWWLPGCWRRHRPHHTLCSQPVSFLSCSTCLQSHSSHTAVWIKNGAAFSRLFLFDLFIRFFV